MYSIYADDLCIYNDVSPLEELKLASPKLVLEDSAAGSLSFTVPVTNAGYSYIKRLVTDISVKKDGAEIWAGRVLSEDEDFQNSRILYCEGELAFLNDTLQPQAEYHDITVENFLRKLVNVHNKKVSSKKRFYVGRVTVTDNNDSLYRYTNYETTLECIKEKLVNRLGGHICIRKHDGKRYIDYIADSDLPTSSQTIEFGLNLMDLTKKWDLTDMATVILPLGAQLEESEYTALESYQTVESVNEDSRMALREKTPFEFDTTGSYLLDYEIYGAKGGVGDYDSETNRYKITIRAEGKNIIKNELTSRTINGVTLTVNSDKSITLNGTATATTSFILFGDCVDSITRDNYQELQNGVYVISGSPSDALENRYIMSFRYDDDIYSDPMSNLARVYPGNITLDNTNGDFRYICPYISIWSGVTANNVKFTPTLIEKKESVISLRSPLTEGKSITYSDANVRLKTVTGHNTLLFLTSVQPSEVYARFSSDETKLYVQSDEAVKTFGWIEKVVHWDDVKTASKLLGKATRYLSSYQFDELGIELSALDMHYLNVDVEEVHLLDKIPVRSRAHGMNNIFPLTKLEIPLDDPVGTVFSLGKKVGKTLTQSLK